jgi:serine O-acetyltransferase
MIHLYRLSNFLFKKKIPFFPKIIEMLIFLLFNSRIPADVEIGRNSSFAYQGLSTLLVKGTKIGNDCLIGMRVTTGCNFPYKNVPNIGNKVWIGANSVIIGPIIIKYNVIIAANSLVNKSVPSGAIVAGNPAKIIGWVKDLDYNIFENPKYKEGTAPYLKYEK